MATNEAFTTMILRFRDLVTAPGNTIPLHQERIDADNATKSTWWGWWAKAGEAPPSEAFAEIEQRVVAAPIQVLLFDTGRREVWIADLIGIKFSATEIESPSKEHTPGYYAEQKYFAWFQFSRFEKVDATRLKQFTYVRRDELFKNQTSNYGAFYGKQVTSTEELRSQDRTIWFVRPFEATTDKTHEVLLLSANTVQPAHFPDRIEASKHRTLLWLSDLHFSTDRHHAFKTDDSEIEHSLANAIEGTLTELQSKELAGILISGDTTWKAAPAEYDLARAFLRRMMSSPTGLENYRALITPGNHDLAFSANPAEKSQPVNVAPEVARAPYSTFYQQLFYLPANRYCSSGRHFLLAHALAVDVVALNTSFLEQKPGMFQGHGFVGQPQLDDAAKGMGWTADTSAPKAFRILMMHHHIMPVTYRDDPIEGMSYSVTLDAEAIVRWVVRHEVDLVLHGHMHECFFATVTRRKADGKTDHTFHVAGLGSSGVHKDHRPAGTANYLGLLKFSRTELFIKTAPIKDNYGTRGEMNEHVITLK